MSRLCTFVRNGISADRVESPDDNLDQTPLFSDQTGPLFPLSSFRLLVPPLCLMSAFMWQVAQERNVMQYGKLEEFVTLVTEMIPELLRSRQRTQLILGLRARSRNELESSESNFVELVKTLLEDPSEKKHFIQSQVGFPIRYGPRYDTALQILVLGVSLLTGGAAACTRPHRDTGEECFFD
ncbi:uncharacterized protein LOC118392533 isoform X3 [Oncorhynchus keta]|uniref:uncharacterized protein LOC118392533 isoform X3 n=1 Tax=Oncorhynchus keta TaxID=8018 RepID=UPI00227C2B5F|nr:uncharacterized protein LOC118392533 isoform X3 [Oncorhynchus keta]